MATCFYGWYTPQCALKDAGERIHIPTTTTTTTLLLLVHCGINKRICRYLKLSVSEPKMLYISSVEMIYREPSIHLYIASNISLYYSNKRSYALQ